MTGFVYFIQAAHGGPIKVGYSATPKKRLAALQTASPWPLAIIGLRPGTRFDERRLHGTLAGHRLRGDWFADCEAVRRMLPAARTAELAPFLTTLLRVLELIDSVIHHAEADRWTRAADDLDACAQVLAA